MYSMRQKIVDVLKSYPVKILDFWWDPPLITLNHSRVVEIMKKTLQSW